MPANIVAGTITFLKIGIDVREGAELKMGDVFSLVGNVAGVLATMAILVAAPTIVIAGLTIVTVGAGLYSILNSETFKTITTNAADFFINNPSDNYFDYVCAPDMRIVHKDTLRAAYNNLALSCSWVAETGELLPSAIAVPNEGGGGWGGISPANPVLPTPPDDIATITIGPLEIPGGSDDSGDEYGCCTGGSDGYV
jgi:hypothetical protein